SRRNLPSYFSFSTKTSRLFSNARFRPGNISHEWAPLGFSNVAYVPVTTCNILYMQQSIILYSYPSFLSYNCCLVNDDESPAILDVYREKNVPLKIYSSSSGSAISDS